LKNPDSSRNDGNPMGKWLECFPPPEAAGPDREEEAEKETVSRKRLKSMKPEASLDLHGLTGEEALASLRGFLAESRKKGHRKVLVIHGKGLHSQGKAVLPVLVRELLEKNPNAGEFGRAVAGEGGSGAVWVMIRQRSR